MAIVFVPVAQDQIKGARKTIEKLNADIALLMRKGVFSLEQYDWLERLLSATTLIQASVENIIDALQRPNSAP